VVIKKLTAILILMIYLPAMAGVGFSTHYCGGEANETKVFSFEKESCCSENPAEDACCSDQIKIVKLDKDQLGDASKISVKPSLATSFVSPLLNAEFFLSCNLKGGVSFTHHSPPLPYPNLPILNCSLLI